MSIYNMDFYRRERRSRLVTKALALVCRAAAAVLLVMGMGALLATVNNVTFAIVSGLIILAGVWGQHYLNTRH